MKKQAFVNANVITMDADLSSAEALGVSGESISIVGTTEAVLAWAGDNAEVIDLDGKTVIPGLIESHNHISIGAMWEQQANCSSVTCSTIEDVLDSISAVIAKTEPGTWVQGFGFDDTAIAEMRHLTRHDLDALTTDHPVFVRHISGAFGLSQQSSLGDCWNFERNTRSARWDYRQRRGWPAQRVAARNRRLWGAAPPASA